jgi:NAD(P)-dependent dehydrogenase (short-subunit alcohol dehydrogenase family)
MHFIKKARNIDNGTKAVDELKKLGLDPRFYQLDIESQESINSFAKYLKDTHGGIDILVNNAAIFINVCVILFKNRNLFLELLNKSKLCIIKIEV